ncbi:unnamed protein product, partial [Mesorhabditis spiculigera]
MHIWGADKHSHLQRIQANIRCAVDRLSIRSFDGLSEVLRCRRCRMESERAIGWKCKNCTSMWNLEWMNGIIGSAGRQNNEISLATRQRDHPTIFKMIELAFCPSRVQKRGMLYCIRLLKPLTGEVHQQYPVIGGHFLKELQRRVENVYNGIFALLDGHDAECLWLRTNVEDSLRRNAGFWMFFRLTVPNKDFMGCLVLEPRFPDYMWLIDR